MVTPVIEAMNGSGKNITTEILLATHTASAEENVRIQPLISGLNGASATITLRCEIVDNNNNPLAYQADIISLAKYSASNTTWGCRQLGPFYLPVGYKLKTYATSTNANDTAASYWIVVLDANPSIVQLGTPVAIDGAAASVSAMLAKMADDNGGATFDATTDSLNKVKATIVTGLPTSDAASAGSVVTGTQTAGTYASTYLYNDTYWQLAPVSPAVNGFGLNATLTFALGTTKRVNTFKVIAKTDIVASVHVWAYNYVTAAWDQISSTTTWISGATIATYTYTLLSSHQKTSDGEVQLRFTSTSTTTNKYLWIDQVLVNSVIAGSGNLTAAEIGQGVANTLIEGNQTEGTIGYALKWQNALIGEVSASDTATSFTITGGAAVANAYVGMIATIEQGATDSARESRLITGYTDAGVITVDRAFSFTPQIGHDVYIAAGAYVGLDAIVAAILANDSFARLMAVVIGNALLTDAQDASNYYALSDTGRTTRIHGFVNGLSGSDSIRTVDNA